jgi:hypothetical protein
LLFAGSKFTKLGRKGIQPILRDITQYIHQMCAMIGSPHSTILRLEMKGSVYNINWSHSNGKPSGSLSVAGITRILSGQRTPVFARVAGQSKFTSPSQLSLSMSIMYTAATPVPGVAPSSTDERSLDIIATDKTIYDLWWHGLHHLLPPKPSSSH